MLKPEHREAIYRLALQQQHADLSDYLDSITAPEGWQVVPVEPSLEMQQAALDASRQTSFAIGLLPQGKELWASGEVWAAMLAAAPKPGGSNE